MGCRRLFLWVYLFFSACMNASCFFRRETRPAELVRVRLQVTTMGWYTQWERRTLWEHGGKIPLGTISLETSTASANIYSICCLCKSPLRPVSCSFMSRKRPTYSSNAVSVFVLLTIPCTIFYPSKYLPALVDICGIERLSAEGPSRSQTI